MRDFVISLTVIVLFAACGNFLAPDRPERPTCADESLESLLLECAADIRAEPDAAKKADLRVTCHRRVEEWRACK